MLMQKAVRFGLVTTKVERSHQSNRHDLNIADAALAIFKMVKSFQKIIAKAENCYNLAVHVVSWFGFGLVTVTLPEDPWIFRSATQGSNLG
jgi:hypothetical protein